MTNYKREQQNFGNSNPCDDVFHSDEEIDQYY